MADYKRQREAPVLKQELVNFAHGELFMLGAYMGVVVISTTGNFWLALILATRSWLCSVRRCRSSHCAH